MPFERLTKILHNLGEQDLEIQKAYAIQLGCIAFSTDQGTEVENYPVTARETRRNSLSDREISRTISESYADIPMAIKAHPNVFDVKTIKKPATGVGVLFGNAGKIMGIISQT